MNRQLARWSAPPRILPSAPVKTGCPPGTIGTAQIVNGRQVCVPYVPPHAMGTVAPFSIQPRYEPIGQLPGTLGSVLSLAGAAAGAYHGYKRNNSIGWAIVWGLFGSIVPVIAVPIAFAQGYAEPKKG